jgi:hypothetical protein
MSASDPPSPALVRAHPSQWDEPPFDASARKLTPDEIQWYAERHIYLDENGDVDEPPEGAMACGIGPFHPNADVIAREKAAKAKAAAKKKAGRTYSDGSYRISKRSPEAARTELIVTNALRYAEDLKKKEDFSQKAPTMPPSRRGRRVHFRC